MTFEQAQLYIKLFILQYYDKNIEDVIPDVRWKGKVSDLNCDYDGDWVLKTGGYVFWANRSGISNRGAIFLEAGNVVRANNMLKINILDYITLEEQTL